MSRGCRAECLAQGTARWIWSDTAMFHISSDTGAHTELLLLDTEQMDRRMRVAPIHPSTDSPLSGNSGLPNQAAQQAQLPEVIGFMPQQKSEAGADGGAAIRQAPPQRIM